MHGRRRTYSMLVRFPVVLAILASGCGGYGEVSPKAYEFAKSIYSISNQKSVQRREKVAKLVGDSHAAGELTDQEHQWLRDIIEQGNNGDWASAAQACRRIMEDQIQTRG